MYVRRSCSCNAFAESACSSVLGQSRFYTSPSLRLCSFHYCSMTSVFWQLPSQQGQSDQFTQADVTAHYMDGDAIRKLHQVSTYMDLSDSDFVYSAETSERFEMAPCLPRWEAPRLLLLPVLLPTSAQLRPFPCSSVALC